MGATERHQEIIVYSKKKSRKGPSAGTRGEESTGGESIAILGTILIGVQRVTRTALYVGCGVAMFAWEAVEKVFQRLYGGARVDEALPAKKAQRKPKRSAKPKKIKVPLLPIDDYDRLHPDQVMNRLDGLSAQALRFLREYEEANQNRKALLREIDRRLAGSSGTAEIG